MPDVSAILVEGPILKVEPMTYSEYKLSYAMSIREKSFTHRVE